MVWLRRTAHRSIAEVAKHLNWPEADVARWETGEALPTYQQLERLAGFYSRPIASFYLAESPPGFKLVERDFRRLAGGVAALSPAFASEHRRIAGQRETALRIAERLGYSPADNLLYLDRTLSVDDASDRLRRWLRMTIEAQLILGDERGILNSWMAKVEEKDVLVAQATGISKLEMRGFAIGDRPFPVVVLNSSEFPRPKLFTLLHELVHVLIRAEGVCDMHQTEEAPSSSNDAIESFCNEVASATVLPSDLVSLELGSGQWAKGDLSRLSARYGLSQEATLLRLVTLGRATWDDYNHWKAELEIKIKNRVEKRSGGDHYRNHLARLGKRYASDVVEAYQRGLIGPLDASNSLNLRLAQVPRMVALLRGEG